MGDDKGYTALHIAVANSNSTAVEFIQDHLRMHNEPVKANVLTHNGATPIQLLNSSRKQRLPTLGASEARVVNRIMRVRTARTYELMRQLGGWFPWEREGIYLW
jgi:hypothetical protein